MKKVKSLLYENGNHTDTCFSKPVTCEQLSKRNMVPLQPVTNCLLNSEWIPADIENVTNFYDFYKALMLQSLRKGNFFELADNKVLGCRRLKPDQCVIAYIMILIPI